MENQLCEGKEDYLFLKKKNSWRKGICVLKGCMLFDYRTIKNIFKVLGLILVLRFIFFSVIF